MRSRTVVESTFLGCAALAAFCVTACSSPAGSEQSNGALSGGDADGLTAFDSVKATLATESAATTTTTVVVNVDASTDPSVITDIVPPSDPGGATPAPLQGTFWMRGNPLPDYLLSFADMSWTSVSGTPYGFLPNFTPGSFAWKEKVVAQGADDGDFTYVPEVCRVPQDDPTLAQIAQQPSTYDSSTYTRSIADDLGQLAGPTPASGTVDPATAAAFLQSIWQTGQLSLDGAEYVHVLSDLQAFYQAKFSPDYTAATVTTFALLSGPLVPITARIPAPDEFASYSLAPHLSDPDIFVRKSFVAGLSKSPDYYLLTRIVDGQGRATPHYQEFLQCVMERSGGRILKVVSTK